MLEHKIVEKEELVVIGKTNKYEMSTAFKEIPAAWEEHLNGSDKSIVIGTYGICHSMDKSSLEYMIADDYKDGMDVPSGFRILRFKKSLWAVFPCSGALPTSLQEITMEMWQEWLPNNSEYKQSGDYYIEYYTDGDPNNDDYYCEIWLPVESK